jgi:hypothetical protein
MISICRFETPSLSISAGTSTGRRPGRMRAITSVCVRACSTSGSTPIQSISSTTGPNRSTAWPPPPTRKSATRSITVGRKPNRCSQYASTGPATLAPEINTRGRSTGMPPPDSTTIQPSILTHSNA